MKLLCLVFLIVLNSTIVASVNLIVKKFEPCDPARIYPLNWNVTIKTVDKQQFIDGFADLQIPFDNNLRKNFSVETLTKKGYKYLFSITDGSSCASMHKNMGQFIKDLEKHTGLQPGVCPINKQKLYIRNYPLKFDGIPTAIPPGTLRFTDSDQDRNNVIVGCNVIVVENKIF